MKFHFAFPFVTTGLVVFVVYQSWPAAFVALIGAAFDALREVLRHKPNPELESLKTRLDQADSKLKEHQLVVDTLTLSGRMQKL